MTEDKSFPILLLFLAGLAAQVIAGAGFLFLLFKISPPPRLGNFADLRYVLEPGWALLGIMVLFIIAALMRVSSIRNLTLIAILLFLAVVLILRFMIWPSAPYH